MIDNIRTKLITVSAYRDKISRDIDEKSCQIKKLKRELKNSQEAQLIIQTVAMQTQQELEYKISEIVSLALSAVFDDPYEFRVEFNIKRGKTEADIHFYKNGIAFDPMTETGGGVVDIAAFALRIALWNLASPRTRNTIILDEPFRFLSKNLQTKASDMLALLSNKLSIQFIIVTHIQELVEAADKVFIVEHNGKSSHIKIM